VGHVEALNFHQISLIICAGNVYVTCQQLRTHFSLHALFCPAEPQVDNPVSMVSSGWYSCWDQGCQFCFIKYFVFSIEIEYFDFGVF
jgi:hypothetical protein